MFYVNQLRSQYNILSSSSTNNLCSGATITLTSQFTHASYQWQSDPGGGFIDITGATASTYGVTVAGVYRMRVGVSNFSNAITILNATALSLSDNLPTPSELFPTLSVYNVSINTTLPPDYTSIDWYFNGALMTTVPLTYSVRANRPGNYMVVASGCGNERSNVDEIRYETTHPNWNTGTFSSGFTYSTPGSYSIGNPPLGYIIGGEIVVQSGCTLTIAAKLNFNGCYGIKVENGGYLIIGDNSILSSTTQWKGVLIEGGGKLLMYQNSYICDAVTAILAMDDAEVLAENCTYGRNVLHVGVKDYDGPLGVFVGSDTFGHVIDSATDLICNSYTEYNNLSAIRGTYNFVESGIVGNNPVQFYENIAWMTNDADDRWNVGFIYALDVDSLDIVSNKVWGFFNYGISVKGGEHLRCYINDFKNLRQSQTSYGFPSPPAYPRFGHCFYFKDVKNARILDNDIRNWMFGMEYYNNINSGTSWMRGNMLRDCKYGLVVANIQNPIAYSGTNNTNQYSNLIPLKFYCNLFKYNDFGIVGTGDIPDQGQSGGGNSAGNRFYDGGLLNSVNSIIWYYTSSPSFNYYNQSIGGNDDPQTPNNGNLLIDGVNRHGGNSDYTIFRTASANSCTSLLSGPALSNKEEKLSYQSIFTFPNPSTGLIIFNGILGNTNIEVLSLEGKIVGIFNILDSSPQLYLNYLPSGLYLLKIKDDIGTTYHKVLLSY